MIKKLIQELLAKNSLELSKDSVEFNKNGQWELKKNKLNIPSHWQWEKNGERPGQAINAPLITPEEKQNKQNAEKRAQNKVHLEKMFKTLEDQQTSSPDQAKKTIDLIKDHVRLQKPGHVDIGHLHDLVRSTQNRFLPEYISDTDFTGMIQNTINGIDSLKDIHKHCGGEGAVKALLRAQGPIGDPYIGVPGYEDNYHKNLKLRLELLKAMNPTHNSLHHYRSKLTSQPPVPDFTFNYDWEKTPMTKQHEDKIRIHRQTDPDEIVEEACANGFMDRFKRHYNL